MHKTDEAEAPTVTDPAAAVAFEALRKEVALVRSAMAGLAAERSAIDIPDYSETLGEILRASAVSANAIKAIGKLPALQQTPRTMAQEIVAAGESARRADQQELLLAREAFEGALREITTSLRSARSEARQRRWLIWTGVGGIFVGMLLWAVGADMIARGPRKLVLAGTHGGSYPSDGPRGSRYPSDHDCCACALERYRARLSDCSSQP